MANSSKRDARKVALAEKQRLALELRLKGASIRAIAAEMKTAKSNVDRWIDEAIAAIPVEPAEKLRKIQLERTERYLRDMDAQLSAGETPAVRAAIRTLDHQAKLTGLYAPTQVTGKDGGPVEVKVSGINVSHLSDSDLAELAAGRIPDALARAAGLGGGGGDRAPQADAGADAAGAAGDQAGSPGDGEGTPRPVP